MRTFLVVSNVLLGVSISSGTAAIGTARTIQDNPNLPVRALHQMVTPRFYQEVVTAPIENWIGIHGLLTNRRLDGCKVISSDGNQEYNSLALELARHIWFPDGFVYTTGTRIPDRVAHLDVLIYKIGGRKFALCLLHLESVDAEGAFLVVLNGNGHAFTVIHPGRDGVRSYW